jgi:hypothetical protein
LSPAQIESDNPAPKAALEKDGFREDRTSSAAAGNFADFESLFAQLSEPPLIELGNPLPKAKYIPRTRVGSCPAAHNRALFRDKD